MIYISLSTLSSAYGSFGLPGTSFVSKVKLPHRGCSWSKPCVSGSNTNIPVCSSSTVALPHPTSWLPPSRGSFKLNIDASFESQGSGFGFVLCDHTWLVLLSGASPLPTALLAFHAECLGLWKSLAAVHCHSNSPLLVESDYLSLVQQL